MVANDFGQLLVCGIAGALALQADNDGLRAMIIQKLDHIPLEITEELVACQRDGKDAVHEIELVVIGIARVDRLNSNVEEPDAVVELLSW